MVSIITPSCNSLKFIGETISSVMSQTYQDWEMIIVDDNSTDGSCRLIDTYVKQDTRIVMVRLEKNRGVAFARNAGIEMAKGRYIAFLDSDDLWLPRKLEKQVSFMRGKDAVLSYTAYKKINEDGSSRKDVMSVPRSVTYDSALDSNSIGCLTAMYDAQQLGKLYMPLVKHEDYALWLQILKKGHTAYGINEVLALYRTRKTSVSGNKLRAATFQWKIYRQTEKLSLVASMRHFVKYAYLGYSKFIR